MPYLSEQDKSDLLFGIENDVDFVAASFVRSKQDIIDLRKFINYNGGHDIRIIAKIENLQGIGPSTTFSSFPTESWWREAIWASRWNMSGFRPSEKDLSTNAIRRKNGYNRHPNARIHDKAPAPHPRRK